MDQEIWVESFEHYPVSEKVITYKGLKPKVNGSLMRYNWHHLRTDVNHPLPEFVIQWLKTDMYNSGDYRNAPKRYDIEGETFKFWFDNQPDFDLREMRERLRGTPSG
jgi:hypothetical protein